MNQPTTAAQLLEMVESSHAEFEQALERLHTAQIERAGADANWSAKDIVSHIALWQGILAERLETLLRGEKPKTLRLPGEVGDQTIDRVNAENYAATKDLPFGEVRAKFTHSYQRALAAMRQLRNEDLSSDSALNTLLGSSIIELIASDTYEHYGEHLPAIRALA